MLGIAVDHAMLYKGTKGEADDDGTKIVLSMTIGDENDFVLEWESGPNRAYYQLFIPIERLKKIIEES